MKTIEGYHGEWNMGSPGGWDYQRIAQCLGQMAWDRLRDTVEIDLDLDFTDPQINAVPGFARMLLRAHKNRHGSNPVHAVVLAEEGTIDSVLENRNFSDYLNTMDGVRASQAEPQHMSMKDGKVCCRGEEATVIFMDFNMNVMFKMRDKHDISPMQEAIRQGILVNPRGMEPIGAKGLFEAITTEYRDQMSPDVIDHTPWTRQFYERETLGPGSEAIPSLEQWTKDNWDNVILKPAHGYSGHGIMVGYKSDKRDENIQEAFDAEDYIVQKLIPLDLWSEYSAGEDGEAVTLKEWQTDFRCFITDDGLAGFLARFGGVPTNVGSGGGIQSIAVLRSPISTGEAVGRLNGALVELGVNGFSQIQKAVNEKAVEMGFTYLNGPIPTTLRPRLLTPAHIEELKRYAACLWKDAVALEKVWQTGALDTLVRISDEEKEMAMAQPWQGSPALMVSDGLFSFGADIRE